MYNYNNMLVRPQYAMGNNIVQAGIPSGTIQQNATGGAIPQWALGQQNKSQHKPQSEYLWWG